ncbi:MAG TPA: hypothetical protein VKH43_02285 [Thermoanaerobaculia bacterium]|nr:hypothetical protein [Thermoanaerobaculia bacterium]
MPDTNTPRNTPTNTPSLTATPVNTSTPTFTVTVQPSPVPVQNIPTVSEGALFALGLLLAAAGLILLRSGSARI